ncbi:MAG: ParB/RepB/Spo0J family partition protein [Clostridia bacterium]|nr:ParB/RepB/Spo0J family partition protein [Clostridia bacterium]MBO6269531.1 ParB/RepB/Spo0J family partition protein [Clostridium sp.]
MPRKGGSVTLSSYDEIFTTEQDREESQQERVQQILLSKLHPFEGHPFRVVDDEEMQKTVESVKQYGVLTPAIARPDPDGGYEILSGHRRLRACELAGLKTLPVIVREMDDDTAIIFMVDSNLQRENILPSERAFAYRMKLDAMKHQGTRTDLGKGSTSTQVAQKLSVERVGEDAGVSKDTVRRFIRLTELIPEIRDLVDEKKIAFNPAVELSYLKPEEQRNFLEAMEYAQAAPSLSQAQRMKKMSQEGRCGLDAMCDVMSEVKKDDRTAITISTDVLRKYFPKSYTPQQMQDVIVKLLDQWQKKRNREQTR